MKHNGGSGGSGGVIPTNNIGPVPRKERRLTGNWRSVSFGPVSQEEM